MDCYQVAQVNAEHIIETAPPPIVTGQAESPPYDPAKHLLAETHNNIAGSATEYNDGATALHHFKIYNKMLRVEHHDQTIVADSRLTSSYYNLGMSHTMNGDYDDAILCFKRALEEAERLSDSRKIKVARSLGLINLGLTYWLMGHQNDASQTLETALKEREELLGKNDRTSMM